MKYFLILFVSLLSNLIFSQEVKTEERFAFESKLIKISNTDSITNYLEKIKLINVADLKDTTTVFDKNSKWELLYLRNSGWREPFPNKRYNINDLYIGKPKNVVLGTDIIDLFSKFHQKITVLNIIPSPMLYLDRGATLNGKFVIILLENNYMTLQYIHSYPNGNQSSWLSITNYYFKKTN